MLLFTRLDNDWSSVILSNPWFVRFSHVNMSMNSANRELSVFQNSQQISKKLSTFSKKLSSFSKKVSTFSKNVSTFSKKLSTFLKKTLNVLKKTLKIPKKTLSFFKKLTFLQKFSVPLLDPCNPS